MLRQVCSVVLVDVEQHFLLLGNKGNVNKALPNVMV